MKQFSESSFWVFLVVMCHSWCCELIWNVFLPLLLWSWGGARSHMVPHPANEVEETWLQDRGSWGLALGGAVTCLSYSVLTSHGEGDVRNASENVLDGGILCSKKKGRPSLGINGNIFPSNNFLKIETFKVCSISFHILIYYLGSNRNSRDEFKCWKVDLLCQGKIW